MSIAKIDLEKLVAKDENELEKLKNVMIDVGFFKLVNYGLSDLKCAEFEEKTKEFFHSSDQIKSRIKLEYASNRPFRGYYGAGVEFLGILKLV